MSDFHIVDIKHINFVLNKYNLSKVGNTYLTVWNFLITNKHASVPIEVADFIIAFNNRNKLQKYKLSELLTNNINIAGITDMSRVTRILKYANKLEDDFYFSMLPEDILFEILSKLDYETILGFCSMSKQFELFCKNNLTRILQISLQNKTKFNTNGFTLKQLYILERNNKLQKHIANFNDVYIINEKGELCIIYRDNSDYTETITLNTGLNIIKVVSGLNFFVLLEKNGKVYIKNRSRFIINSSAVTTYMKDKINKITISEIEGINNAIDIIANTDSVLILLSDGSIMGFGNNEYGTIPNVPNPTIKVGNQIIKVPFGNVEIPTLVPNLNNIRYMEYGYKNMYFVSNDDEIHEIYYNDEEDYNFEEQLEGKKIIKIQDWNKSILVLNSDGEVLLVTEKETTKVFDNIIDISSFQDAGFDLIGTHINIYGSLFLDRDGNVYLYGLFRKGFSNDESAEIIDEKRVKFNLPTKSDNFKNIVYIFGGNLLQLFLVDKDHNLYINHIDESGKYKSYIYPNIKV
jgi:hypothetical protein